jgi:hypothetical protein
MKRLVLGLFVVVILMACAAPQAIAQTPAEWASAAQSEFNSAAQQCQDAYNSTSNATVRGYLNTAIGYYNNAAWDAYCAWWYFTYTSNYSYADYCASQAMDWSDMAGGQTNNAYYATSNSTVRSYISNAALDADYGWFYCYDAGGRD